jgi:hypothetical protein
MPVLTVNGIGDIISTVAGQDAYERAVRAAGREELLRQVYTRSAGHCGFSAGEVVAAVDVLMTRLDTGAWGELDAETMNARAGALAPGEARFLSYVPDAFVRATDGPSASQ